jgi:folate-binding protein YgfZ
MSSWQDFLTGQGYPGVDLAADLAAAQDGLVLADLSHYGLLGLGGEDARDFLQNQISNDLRGQTPEQGVFAAYCTPKGRMLANFIVIERQGERLLLLPRALVAPLQKRLSMYILRSKVMHRDASESWVGMGLSGPGADAVLRAVLGLAPPPGLGVAHSEDAFAIALGEGRFDVFVAPERAPAIWQALAAKARPVASAAWDGLLVRAGIPVVLPETQDHFVPQMANMDALHGISFNKGCYPGQEVVARAHWVGKVKRRLFLAHVDATPALAQEVFSAAVSDQAAGQVANLAPAPGGGFDLLVVLREEARAANDVSLGGRDGPRLSFMDLPYVIEEVAA